MLVLLTGVGSEPSVAIAREAASTSFFFFFSSTFELLSSWSSGLNRSKCASRYFAVRTSSQRGFLNAARFAGLKSNRGVRNDVVLRGVILGSGLFRKMDRTPRGCLYGASDQPAELKGEQARGIRGFGVVLGDGEQLRTSDGPGLVVDADADEADE